MCGICGLFNKDRASVSQERIKVMCDKMVHRGPDDEGIYITKYFGMGIRRLKIIDLLTGHQPIHNEDKSVWVVLNGEIYNYLDLRKTLEHRGHYFYTQSDTEVIVHLYEDYGEQALQHLNGMFSIALWDTYSNTLFLARDRLGIKQLYYFENEIQFIFGSEIKAILAFPHINRDIDYNALSDFFSLQYIPAPNTIYKNIKKLPAACYLKIDINSKRSTISKYWSLNYIDSQKSIDAAIDTTENKLQKAINDQMISDVPLGAYLSGGIDSSLLVAIMATQSNQPVETFSIIWDQKNNAFDERYYARFVAEKYHTNHHEFLVKPDFQEVAEKIVTGFDEPFADDSVIPNYYIAHETRKHVTVALSGLGGDEMSAGYERYLGLKLLHYYKLLPENLRTKVISKVVNNLSDSHSGGLWIERIKRFTRISDQNMNFVDNYFNISSTMDDKQKQLLFTQDIKKQIGSTYDTAHYFHELKCECNSPDELNCMLFIDINTYMVDQLLVLSDRMSMAHSLELRVPYLDHLLVEHFATIAPSIKLRYTIKKYLLKKIAERYFPKRFIYRKKMGFSSPIVLWLRNDLKDYMLHILNRRSIDRTGIINSAVVHRFIEEHLVCKHNHDKKLWSLIMFMLWYNLYIDKIL